MSKDSLTVDSALKAVGFSDWDSSTSQFKAEFWARNNGFPTPDPFRVAEVIQRDPLNFSTGDVRRLLTMAVRNKIETILEDDFPHNDSPIKFLVGQFPGTMTSRQEVNYLLRAVKGGTRWYPKMVAGAIMSENEAKKRMESDSKVLDMLQSARRGRTA